VLVVVLVGIVLLGLYFVPTFVAFSRRHKQRVAICVLNIFAGWTAILWVVALAWSFTSDVEKEDENAEEGGWRQRLRQQEDREYEIRRVVDRRLEQHHQQQEDKNR
jgi:hypothetical protein